MKFLKQKPMSIHTRFLPKTEIWIAYILASKPLHLRLAEDGCYEGEQQLRNGKTVSHPFFRAVDIRVPVEHVLAVGDTEAIALGRGETKLALR